MKDFSQTRAALILLKNRKLQYLKCNNQFDTYVYVQQLCKAVMYDFETKGTSDVSYKEHIAYSFTNPCYFLIEGFSKNQEDIITDGLYYNNRGTQSKSELEEYFGKSIEEVITVPNDFAFSISNVHHEVPDLRKSFAGDLYRLIGVLQQKERVFTKTEIRELLVYFIIDLLEEYQKKSLGRLPKKVVGQIFSQVEDSAKMLLNIPYESVSPKQEVIYNMGSSLIIKAKDKYLDYLTA